MDLNPTVIVVSYLILCYLALNNVVIGIHCSFVVYVVNDCLLMYVLLGFLLPDTCIGGCLQRRYCRYSYLQQCRLHDDDYDRGKCLFE